MSASPQAVAILLLVFALVAVVLLTRQAGTDFASPLRNWLWARDARRYAARNAFPATLRRSYWNVREYQRDKARLAALGYVIVSETISEPYYTPAGWSTRGQPPRRRVPVYFVIFEFRAPHGDDQDARARGA